MKEGDGSEYKEEGVQSNEYKERKTCKGLLAEESLRCLA